MMLKYNGIIVPEVVRTDILLSAFANEMDWSKVEEYAELMAFGEEFPPILGYPSIMS